MSRPLTSALASAFFKRSRRCVADLTGQRARVTPNCFPFLGTVLAEAHVEGGTL